MTFTTWDPNNNHNITLSGGNLIATGNTAGDCLARGADVLTAGLLYFEIAIGATVSADTFVGVAGSANDSDGVAGSSAVRAFGAFNSGNFYLNGVSQGTGLGGLTSSTLCVAIDFTHKTGWVRVNGGNWNANVANNPATNTGGVDLTTIIAAGLVPVAAVPNTGTATANFGASAFAQAVPSGFSGWGVSTSTTLYTNTGGTGNRTASITATSTLTISGTFNHIIDGNLANHDMFFSGSSVGSVMKFDFGVGASKIIDGFRFYNDRRAAHGTWQWEGSPDDITYTALGNTFTLGGALDTDPTVFFEPSGNTTAYRFYRMKLTAGATSGSPWVDEIEFKIADAPAMAPNYAVGVTMTASVNAGFPATNHSLGVTMATSPPQNFPLVKIPLAPFLLAFSESLNFATNVSLPKTTFNLGLAVTRWEVTQVVQLAPTFSLGASEVIARFGTTLPLPAVSMALGINSNLPLITGGSSRQIHTVIDVGT